MLTKGKNFSLIAALILFLGATFISMQDLLSADYYVGGMNASDTNPGTALLPFATIHKASTVAVAGDIVNIRAGIYRETIVPANSGTPDSPITYQPDGSDIVTISGLNTTEGGWILHTGNIYKKAITLPANRYNATSTNNTTLLANQIFKDGVMMFEARWPKINTLNDLLDRTKFQPITNATGTTITDNNIPPNIVGATLWLNGWYVTKTADVTSQSGSTITFTPSQSDAKKRKYFYLTGKLNLLTQEKEWHYDSGTLYFWQEGGGIPTGMEYKARNYGFDLSDKSYTTIKGLEFFGCDPVKGSTNSTNIIIDGIKAKYLNHAVIVKPVTEPGVSVSMGISYWNARQTGIKLIGPNSIIKNSEIQYASSQAIWLGEGCIAENNLIHDIGYEGNYGCGVIFWKGTSNQKVIRNSMYRMGRSAVDFGYAILDEKFNIEIAYNDFSDYGKISTDLGATYAGGFKQTDGTRVHHNWIHDAGVIFGDGVNTAIYWDMGSGPSTNDHNVCWNINGNGIFTNVCYENTPNPASYYYNNVFADKYTFYSQSYKSPCKTPVDIQRNNIYSDDIMVALGSVTPDVANSLLEGVNPQYIGTGIGGLAFRITSGSPAINAGIDIPGITDGSIGAPDIGAYEYGGEEWVAGYQSFGYSNYYSLQVEFVDSASGELLEGLEVFLRNVKQLTNAEGIISISDIPVGNYKLVISDNRFVILGSDILEVRSDSLIQVYVKKLPTFTIQVQFVDYNSGEPMEELGVNFKNFNYLTNVQGIISVPDIPQGSYKLAIPDSRYVIMGDDMLDVHSDSLFTISVFAKPYLTLKVINRTTGSSIYRAMVAVDGQSYTSNASGIVTIGEYSFGSFVFSATHTDYFSIEDTLVFTGDTTIILKMTPKRANVIMQISDLSGPVSTVKVTLAGSQYTNSAGNAFFNFQPARQNYSYSVEKSGYNPVQGNFYLEIDTSLVIMIDRLTSVHIKNNMEIMLSPNPFHSYINISIPENSLLYVYDVSGRLRNTVFLERGMNTIPTGDLENGAYIFKIIEGLLVYNKLMFK